MNRFEQFAHLYVLYKKAMLTVIKVSVILHFLWIMKMYTMLSIKYIFRNLIPIFFLIIGTLKRIFVLKIWTYIPFRSRTIVKKKIPNSNFLNIFKKPQNGPNCFDQDKGKIIFYFYNFLKYFNFVRLTVKIFFFEALRNI